MVFLEQIREKLGLGLEELTGGVRALVFGDKGVHVEGHKGLAFMSEDEIVFYHKKGKIKIVGQGLKVRELSEFDGYVYGKIKGVFWGGKDGEF